MPIFSFLACTYVKIGAIPLVDAVLNVSQQTTLLDEAMKGAGLKRNLEVLARVLDRERYAGVVLSINNKFPGVAGRRI